MKIAPLVGVGGEPVLLGLDLGTSHFKAVLLSGSELLGMNRVRSPFESTVSGAEMSVPSMLVAVQELLAPLRGSLGSVAAVGIASMGESGAVLDNSSRVASSILIWNDKKGEKPAERLRKGFPELPSIGRPMRAKSSAALLAYWVDCGLRPAKWLGVAELLAWKLSGEMFSEPSLAARTCAYNILTDEYIPEILDTIGAPRDVFPETYRTVLDQPGVCSTSFASGLGLRRGVPVLVAGHDHLMSALGVGAGVEDLVDSLGTSELLLRYCDTLSLREVLSHGCEAALAPGTGLWAITMCPAYSGEILGRLRRDLMSPSWGSLDQLALRAAPEDKAAWAGVLGRISQSGRSVAPAGADLSSTIVGALWACAIDELSEAAKHAAEVLDRLLGQASRWVILGGGSAGRYWLDRKRALSADRPVVRPAVSEAVAVGAAVIAVPRAVG